MSWWIVLFCDGSCTSRGRKLILFSPSSSALLILGGKANTVSLKAILSFSRDPLGLFDSFRQGLFLMILEGMLKDLIMAFYFTFFIFGCVESSLLCAGFL